MFWLGLIEAHTLLAEVLDDLPDRDPEMVVLPPKTQLTVVRDVQPDGRET